MTIAHDHPGMEEFLILEGDLVDSDGAVFGPGDFVSYEAGTHHNSWSETGCLIAVFEWHRHSSVSQDASIRRERAASGPPDLTCSAPGSDCRQSPAGSPVPSSAEISHRLERRSIPLRKRDRSGVAAVGPAPLSRQVPRLGRNRTCPSLAPCSSLARPPHRSRAMSDLQRERSPHRGRHPEAVDRSPGVC